MSAYWALVHGDEGCFGISFPDVPGCISAADTLEDVLDEGREALSAHLAVLKAEKEAIPRPRTHGELTSDPDADWGPENATWHRIEAKEVAAPRLRINVTVPPDVLRAADAAAEAIGQTRSGYFEDAVRERLDLARKPVGPARDVRARARR